MPATLTKKSSSVEPGNEPYVAGDEVHVNGRGGTAAYSAVVEGYLANYYHLSVVWQDDLTTAQFTDNQYRAGMEVVTRNPRTRQSTRLIQYTRTSNETERNAHAQL